MRYLFSLFLLLLVFQQSFAMSEGESIYMTGIDAQGNRVPAVLNDLASDSALGCVNCHRESGLGSSESGRTYPPVSWRFLGRNQPEDDSSRFYHIQNKRKAYDADSFYRLLTTGINSNAEVADGLMPKYALTRQQSDELIAYLKTINSSDDAGVDGDVIRIATIVDKRLPELEREQHIAFLQGLFEMKNGLTRGELRRKAHSPVQKIPQYESFRNWELVVWELPEDTALWSVKLQEYYQQNPVFTVLRPMVEDDYAIVGEFCTSNKLSCFFPSGKNLPAGDFYNFVFRNSEKQQVDYIASQQRKFSGRLLYIDQKGDIQRLTSSMTNIPVAENISLAELQTQYASYCTEEAVLLLKADIDRASVLERLKCPLDAKLIIKLIQGDSINYRSIVDFMRENPASQVCWISDYAKVLKRNFRRIRVNAMVSRFNIKNPDEEELAKTLFAYGLFSDSLHKMAGNFSRIYMIEIIEHMLNSFLNYTYFSSISGAPYQRYIVGPLEEYCPAGERE
jgi:hypothetical protein